MVPTVYMYCAYIHVETELDSQICSITHIMKHG